MTVTSRTGKRCIFYSCTILLMTAFHELLPFSQLSDLTTTTTICNTTQPQLHSDRFNPALDVNIIINAGQKAVIDGIQNGGRKGCF